MIKTIRALWRVQASESVELEHVLYRMTHLIFRDPEY